MSTLKVALVQMIVTKNKADNLKKAKDFIGQAKKENAKLIILPEMFQTPYDTKLFSTYAEEKNGETWQLLQILAKEHQVFIVGGSIVEKEGDKLYNTSFVFSDKGEELAKHRKVHLFDIDIKNGQSFKESDTLTKGEGVTSFLIGKHRFALGICFDIRFATYANLMKQSGAEVFIYPAAFNSTTGPKHWELLFRSRANDNQVYTIGVSSLPSQKEGYPAYGHSIVVNPWAEVVLDMKTEEGVAYAILDFDLVKEVRRSIPLN